MASRKMTSSATPVDRPHKPALPPLRPPPHAALGSRPLVALQAPLFDCVVHAPQDAAGGTEPHTQPSQRSSRATTNTRMASVRAPWLSTHALARR